MYIQLVVDDKLFASLLSNVSPGVSSARAIVPSLVSILLVVILFGVLLAPCCASS